MSSDDIVTQLRAGGRSRPEPLLCDIAADEIERLRFDCAELLDGLGRKHDYACRMHTLAEERLMEITRLRAERDASRLMISDLEAEMERLRAERDDHKARLAVEAVTAPDADYETMMDSLQARLRDLHAEVDRLRDENAAFRAQFAFADEIREAFANWDGTDASLPEGWRREW